MSSLPAAASTSQNITLPNIPELFNENFLDVLLPPCAVAAAVAPAKMDVDNTAPATSNAMMDALKSSTNYTLTENGAPALQSTLSATLDAFNGMHDYTDGDTLSACLRGAWAEDPALTLRIIWCLRSIPDGKGNKELFYRAFGWLYAHHPRTAIANLGMLVEEVSLKKKAGKLIPHGYWKDLLNIVAMAAVDDLEPGVMESKFLHSPRQEYTYGRNKKKKRGDLKEGTSEDRIAAHLETNARKAEEARAKRSEMFRAGHERLEVKLAADSKFRALYIAVARLFAGQLAKDLEVLNEAEATPGKRMALLRNVSLAGKWAPTPGLSHDKVTNLSSAIALLLSRSQLSTVLPKVIRDGAGAPLTREQFAVLRSFYGRWILRPLRAAVECPEPLMAANKWDKVKYTRVPSVAMQNHTELFFKHDQERFKQYLMDVESGAKTISGATLFPHEILSTIIAADVSGYEEKKKGKSAAELQAFKKQLAETKGRVAEAQWKTLVDTLRAHGALDNCLAVCDVSGSMGSIYAQSDSTSKKKPQPILNSVALSLILASVTKAPFNGGFVTFSESPQFVQLDLTKSVGQLVKEMVDADWGYNTNLQAVFVDLLLPLAKRNNVKQEDMIKRLFIFTDMQFDQHSQAVCDGAAWDTNYDVIERAYKEAGYEVPEIVYWDLEARTGRTVEVLGDRKGVAMLNGFSPSLLKVFMGEEEEEEEKWDMVGEEVKQEKKAEEEFNPVNVMKRVLGRKSFDGLVVVD